MAAKQEVEVTYREINKYAETYPRYRYKPEDYDKFGRLKQQLSGYQNEFEYAIDRNVNEINRLQTEYNDAIQGKRIQLASVDEKKNIMYNAVNKELPEMTAENAKALHDYVITLSNSKVKGNFYWATNIPFDSIRFNDYEIFQGILVDPKIEYPNPFDKKEAEGNQQSD